MNPYEIPYDHTQACTQAWSVDYFWKDAISVLQLGIVLLENKEWQLFAHSFSLCRLLKGWVLEQEGIWSFF